MEKKMKLLTVFISIIIFGIMLNLVLMNQSNGIDNFFYRVLVENCRSEWLTIFFTVVTNMGGYIILVSISALIFVFYKNRNIGVAIVRKFSDCIIH